jgi:nucleotide-binding universal stress UspA family protein
MPEGAMPEGAPPATRGRRPVVAGVDGSECALAAVRWAAAEAARRRLPLRLVAAHTWPAGGFVGDPGLGVDPRAVLRDVVLGHLTAATAVAAAVVPGLAVEQVDVDGDPAVVLAGESKRAELVVLGDRGLGGFTGLLLGSVAVALSAHAACPVVVVRGVEADPAVSRPEPVVVGVDGSQGSTAAVDFAVEAAVLRGVPLVAVHAWRDVLVDATMAPLVDWDAVESDEREVLAERLAGTRTEHPDLVLRRLVVRDRPARALVDESRNAQLVVVGSRGRGGIQGLLLGSVSQQLLHHAHCPVAVVRTH